MNSQRVRTSSYIFEEFMVWFDISHDDFAEIISKNGMYFQSVAKMTSGKQRCQALPGAAERCQPKCHFFGKNFLNFTFL